MSLYIFAAENADSVESTGILGVSFSAFIVQLITFLLVFLVLKRFAFTPIIRLLDKRRSTIDAGVKAGIELEKEREVLEKTVRQVMRDARKEADNIIGNGHKEAREILRDAESKAKRKSDSMFIDAEARINEETKQARKRLEHEIVELVAEATEAIVGEKVDAKKDAHIIKKVIKERTKK